MSTDYRLRVQLQLYSVLLSMRVMYCDCNHYTIIGLRIAMSILLIM